jgi:crotonobetainyl-CoA:carnitine CoA-transferase CaiB-like acyl-CoA transferase
VHDVHAQNRDLVTWVDQPGVGKVSQIRFPVAFPSMETRRGELAPGVGEHTDLILAELGYSPSEIEDLHRSKAV